LNTGPVAKGSRGLTSSTGVPARSLAIDSSSVPVPRPRQASLRTQAGTSAPSRAGRNDLEASAIALCPVVAEVLAELSATGAWLVRMSGSGATCFALYGDEAARDAAAGRITVARPGWWQMAGLLR
jgi:4-diphosphocytidyl-2C-methyl-D-erythritol kinase